LNGRFVSHAWSGRWGDLVAALADNGRTPLDYAVWIDVLSVLQHPQTGGGDEQQKDLGEVRRNVHLNDVAHKDLASCAL
jgi:hypothetical protein